MWWWTVAVAAPWEQVDDAGFASAREWTNEVEIGDLDGDGDLDVILANGGGYSTPGNPEPTRWLVNDGGRFTDTALPNGTGLHRTAKIRDFSGDGVPDLFLAGAWQTPSVLLLGDGAGGLVDASGNLPTDALAIGDAEPGDVDGDGDLDLVLSDSGDGNALFGDGETSRLWTNDGAGGFVDGTVGHLPVVAVGWSWDLELADLDGDLDLDLVISCKTCDGGFLFANDGTGTFTNRTSGMPQRTNNYEYEALDYTGDGLPDLVTINDGPGLTERLLVNDGTGAFVDETATRLPPSENSGDDDNVAVMLDFDHDADVDILIGSLSGSDRVLVNDGTGQFTNLEGVLAGPSTRGTLGLAVGDLDDDGRLDVVMGQGEAAETDYLYFGVDVPVDTVPPLIGTVETFVEPLTLPVAVRAEVHDRKTPVTPDDLVVTLEVVTATSTVSLPMTHLGHVVWRAVLDGVGAGTYQVCATDRAGNSVCGEEVAFGVVGEPTDPGTTDTGTPPTDGTTDTGTPPDDEVPPDGDEPTDDEKGCGCATGGSPSFGWVVALGWLVRRRTKSQ